MPTTTPQPDQPAQPTAATLAFQANRLEMEVTEALYGLRDAILAKADHELLRVNQALHEAGIDYPTGAAGVRDLNGHWANERQAIADQMKEHRSNFGWTSAQGTTEEYQKGFIDGMQFMIAKVEEG